LLGGCTPKPPLCADARLFARLHALGHDHHAMRCTDRQRAHGQGVAAERDFVDAGRAAVGVGVCGLRGERLDCTTHLPEPPPAPVQTFCCAIDTIHALINPARRNRIEADAGS
jgi:hypothetical protein